MHYVRNNENYARGTNIKPFPCEDEHVYKAIIETWDGRTGQNTSFYHPMCMGGDLLDRPRLNHEFSEFKYGLNQLSEPLNSSKQ